MAEAVLEIALHNLSSLLQKELGLFLGVDREMELYPAHSVQSRLCLKMPRRRFSPTELSRIGCASSKMQLTRLMTSWMSVPQRPFDWSTKETRYEVLACPLSFIPSMLCSVSRLLRK